MSSDKQGSRNLINIIKNNFDINLLKLKYCDDDIIKYLNELYFNMSKDVILKLENTQNIQQLHNNNIPLLFVVLTRMNKLKKIQNMSFKNFVCWYRINGKNINLYEVLSKTKYYDIIFNPPKNRIKLHNLLYSNSFMPLDVIHHAETSKLTLSTYKGNNETIEIYNIEDGEMPNITLMSNIITFFRTLTKKNIPVNIIIFYGCQTKELPYNWCEKCMCSDNVNSGCASPGKYIYIWRQAEFYKVMIHELIHYFKLDYFVNDYVYNEINKLLHSKFNVDDDNNNESYTETLAVTIHSLFYSNINKISFDNVLCMEKIYFHLQIAKIMKYFDMNSINDLYTLKINQTTNVCSYYIVKTMFINKYQIILDHWKTNGFVVLKSQKTQEEYIKIYKQIISENLIDESLIKKWLNILNTDNNYYMNNTMNMVLLYLD
jgi:hypothetical protein